MAAPCPHSRARVGDRVLDRPEQPWLQQGFAHEGMGTEPPRPEAWPSQEAFAWPPAPRADTVVLIMILKGVPPAALHGAPNVPDTLHTESAPLQRLEADVIVIQMRGGDLGGLVTSLRSHSLWGEELASSSEVMEVHLKKALFSSGSFQQIHEQPPGVARAQTLVQGPGGGGRNDPTSIFHIGRYSTSGTEIPHG